MEAANASTSSEAAPVVEAAPSAAAKEAAARAVNKRFDALMTVRTKAINGKGAWYWAHLEPILLPNSDSTTGGGGGHPKSVKLRCSLCHSLFSASNPSRTASEHLKRGTCPNFSSLSSSSAPKPISSLPPPSPPQSHKRSSTSSASPAGPLALMSAAQQHQRLVLSGGKEDLSALAMLEDSVKRLKSPKASPVPALPKPQADSALSLLSDWLFESPASVSLSSFHHPKFQSFLHQVGLPSISPRYLAGPLLDSRYHQALSDSDARIRQALFFQLSSSGWNSTSSDHALVNLTVNLPNGTTVFRRSLLTTASAPSDYAEELLWDAATTTSSGLVDRCVGIIADRFKSKALRNLETQHHWMVNLSCQLQGFCSLIKDFSRELPLFGAVASNCSKLANFFNTQSQVRTIFHKYQLQELDHSFLLRTALQTAQHIGNGAALSSNYALVFAMLEDIKGSDRALQLAVLDEDYKLVSLEDPIARESAELIQNLRFWTELEAVHSLIKLVKVLEQEMEAERPLVGQCLPLWDELRSKVKDWCAKFSIEGGPVEKVIERRFKKNYHPAWSAAFILDPLYLIKDTSGKYLPPFKCLTPEQEKDVDRLIMRLVSREEAHIALMELMKWRSEGLDPLYAQAVQVKQPDPTTGKMRIANPQSSRLVWETCLSEFKSLGKVAVRLIFLHATSCGFKCDLSLLQWVCAHGRSRAGMDRAHKMVFVAAHAKLERRDFSC